jgi:uncharacterized protein YecT (DUF1311 family)
MRRSHLFLSLALLAPTLRAQQNRPPLSFQPGGLEACAQALQPSPPPDPLALRNACADRDLQIEAAQLEALAREIDRRSPEERVAFNVLMVSFTDLRDNSARLSACSAGLACQAAAKQAKARFNEDFLELAARRIQLPEPSFAAADADLNATYDQVFASLPATCDTSASAPGEHCLSQTAFRERQREWIRYRDAWLTFVKLRWPQDPPDAWLTYLTRQRTAQLKPASAS